MSVALFRINTTPLITCTSNLPNSPNTKPHPLPHISTSTHNPPPSTMPANPGAIQQRQQAVPPQYSVTPPTRPASHQHAQPPRAAPPSTLTPYARVSEAAPASQATVSQAPTQAPEMANELAMLASLTEEMRAMAAEASDTAVLEQAKQDLEKRVERMQSTLHAVNQHLEEEQEAASRAAETHNDEKKMLLAEITHNEASLCTLERDNETLQKELAELTQRNTTQTADFALEKQNLNQECSTVRDKIRSLETQLRELAERKAASEEECRVTKSWLDRGVDECTRITHEAEATKAHLKKTAQDWEDDHSELTQKLANLDAAHREAVQERGALAVNLTVARSRVVEDSRNLHKVVPTLNRLGEQCAVLEASLQATNPRALQQLQEIQTYVPGTDVLAAGGVLLDDLEAMGETAPQSSHHVREACNALFKNFFGVLQAASSALQRWEVERDMSSALPRKIQEAQSAHKAQKDANEKLKMHLNELRGDCERWRQNAQQADPTYFASNDKPLSRQERQSLVQAQAVAATLYREKQALQKESDQLRSETNTLRSNLIDLQSENKLMKEEMARLRGHVVHQASHFDTFRPLKPGM